MLLLTNKINVIFNHVKNVSFTESLAAIGKNHRRNDDSVIKVPHSQVKGASSSV